MKIPFDIKYRPKIESGEYKVCDQNGNDARIICWDALNKANPDQCIIALIREGSNNDEDNKWYDTKGFGALGHNRLFIITPEPELTPFEQHLLVYFQKVYYAHCESQDVNNFLIGTIKQCSKSLLELAKKEICKGCIVGLEQYWKGRDDERKEHEKPITYHYPMCEPPCFIGGICADHIRDCIHCPRTTGDTSTSTTSGTCKKD